MCRGRGVGVGLSDMGRGGAGWDGVGFGVRVG